MGQVDGAGSRTALVGYGSETGNALDYAEELGRMLERLHFATQSSLSSFSFFLLVTSTTGQGDIPNNAQAYWKTLLRKKLPYTYLHGVDFTTFGLGDSSYPKYNFAVRKFHKRLIQLGATEIYSRGEADEQHEEGSDAAFVPWALDLRRELLVRFPLPSNLKPIPDDDLLPPKWLLSLADKHDTAQNEPSGFVANGKASSKGLNDGTAELSVGVSRTRLLTQKDIRLTVELAENRRLTSASHWQDVRHLAFVSESTVTYKPGDVLAIYPQNAAEHVNGITKLMKWDDVKDKVVHFVQPKQANHSRVPQSGPLQNMPDQHCSLRDLLTNHLDLTAIPRRSFFSLLSHFTKDQYQKERLLEFTRPEYIDELYDYTTRPRRSILEVLQEFDTVKIPWQWAANVLPELRGRQFSIASGGSLKNDIHGRTRFELLAAIVKYKTVIKRIREGVCTRYLTSLQPGRQIEVTLQKGSLGAATADLHKPVIMIGPGTGVAPIRSLIWERLQIAERLAESKTNGSVGFASTPDAVGKMLLIFGCRSENSDYFYRDEWESIKSKLPLEVHVAFSRDQAHKVYVQDVIRQQKAEIYRLLHDLEGTVYVCGSSGKMPAAVRAALTDAFQGSGAMKEEQSQAYLDQMERNGRYKQETWG